MNTPSTPSEEQIDRYSFYSDLYKSIYNIRPRWLRAIDHTVERWDSLIEDLLGQQREDRDDRPPLDRFTG